MYAEQPLHAPSVSCMADPFMRAGASLFGIEMSFLWYRGGLSLICGVEISLWYRDLFFGIEILRSVVQHLDRLLPGISPRVLF